MTRTNASGEGSPGGRARGQRKRETIKYRELAAVLRHQIQTGALPAGSVLPSETELMTTYGISRPTARAAVNALKGEGLVTVQHGRGAFVRRADDRARHTQTRALHGTRTRVDAVADPAGNPEWRDVEDPGHYRTNADVALALALGVAEHTPIFISDRLLEGPDEQRAAYRLYVPVPVAADCDPLADDPFRDPTDLYTLLSDTFGALSWTEYVRARMPAPDDANALKIGDNTPMLVTRRVTTDKNGRILAVEETRCTAEDTQLAYPIQPGRSARGSNQQT